MGSRLDLHMELLTIESVKVYHQPPSNIKLVYPCIVYQKIGKDTKYGNDGKYISAQQYQITVIDHDPDSNIADVLEDKFEYCYITQYFTNDNLNHTILTLYY